MPGAHDARAASYPRSELSEFGGIDAVVTEVVEGVNHHIEVSDVESFRLRARWASDDPALADQNPLLVPPPAGDLTDMRRSAVGRNRGRRARRASWANTPALERAQG